VDEHVVHILLGFAGVGATFTGFSGVVAVFGRRVHGEWFPEDRFRLTNLMATSLGACLLAFAPLVGALLHLSASTMWALVSAALGLACSGYLLYAGIVIRRLRRARPGLLPLWVSLVFALTLAVAAVLQILNVASVFFDREAGPYLAGLLALLLVAALQFAFLVIIPMTAASDRPVKP
jgi:hypothetical protein